MKNTFPRLVLGLACGLFPLADLAHAQGTAFTYQGQLQSGGAPASGTYDFEFTLYSTNMNGTSVAGPVTNLSTAVNGGLFLATVNFGSGVFTGSNYWLDIAVRTNGAVTFTELAPRQPVTPAPYAIFANTASNLSGTLPAAQLSGALPSSALTGNGANLTNVNATTVGGLNTTNIWQTGGNNLASGQVLGSTNNQPLTLIANGSPAVVITPYAAGPDIVVGAAQNTINGSSSPGSSILGGSGNYVSGGSPYSVIGGGQNNSVSLNNDFIGGGSGNAINYPYGVIGGGLNNNSSYSYNSFIGGGNGNTLAGSTGAVIGGGLQNTINNAYYTFLGSGENNYIEDSAGNSVLVGGYHNTNNAYYAFIGGGANNYVSGNYGSVPGGNQNVAGGQYSFAAGQQAQAINQGAFVWADSQNAPFASTTNDSFNVRAQGGVYFATGGAGLRVSGNVTATSFTGNGAGLTNLTLTSAELPAGLVTNNEPITSLDAVFVSALTLTGSGSLNLPSPARITSSFTPVITFDTNENSYLGLYAGSANSGSQNVAIGYDALGSSSADTGVVAIGYQALANDTFTGSFIGSSGNSAVGYDALTANTTGVENTALGFSTLAANTDGQNNTAIGFWALLSNSHGQNNVAVGANALQANTAGTGNIGIGNGAGGSITTGNNNIDIGNFGVGNDSGIIRIGTSGTQTATYLVGTVTVPVLTISGGSDLAEPFKMSGAENQTPEGSVVVIDEANPGHLKLSDHAYDSRVAGVVSGANGIHPGIQMHQDGLLDGGKNVALTGRVYVKADASNGAIKPGDLLTTSRTPGVAMKVTDHAKAQGAILGKAMTGLNQGNGMVLVLVTLQ